MKLLFSYGSNGPEQIASRIGKQVAAHAALVEGYRRVFRGWSDRWGGAPASIIRKPGAVVYGSACFLSDTDLQKLSRFEGRMYKLVHVPVEVDLGHGLMVVPNEAVAFVSISDEWGPPSPAYLKAIAKNVGMFWKSSGGKKLKPSDFYNED